MFICDEIMILISDKHDTDPTAMLFSFNKHTPPPHGITAINGYVAETLPGLLVAQYQQVRWHLLNVGSDTEYHAVHFHGLAFNVHGKQGHRMGVYNLYPGEPTDTHTQT